MKQMRLGLCACLLAMISSSTATAKDLYVNNVLGDDARNGAAPDLQGGIDGPLRSIERALEKAENGDRIVIANTGKPYRESLTLQAKNNSGVQNRPFQILGNGAVIDGSRGVQPKFWKYVGDGVYRFRPPKFNHQILFHDNRPLLRVPAPRSEPRPKLKALEWCLHRNDIYFRPERGKTTDDYRLSHTALPVGLTLYEVRHVVISDLIIQGFQLDGLNAHDGVYQASLLGLTCRGNGRSGISIGGASRVKIDGCLVGNNGEAQVRTEGFSRTEIVDSELLENTAPGLVQEGGKVSVKKPAEREAKATKDAFRR